MRKFKFKASFNFQCDLNFMHHDSKIFEEIQTLYVRVSSRKEKRLKQLLTMETSKQKTNIYMHLSYIGSLAK